jgi:hypothetical protein
MSNRPSRLETALAYAQFGWAVLPLHHVENGHCSCGDTKCKSPGKHPRTRHGVKDASKDPAIIRAWFAKWPNANIGIATGSISRLVVVDVDGEKGEAKLATLTERGFKLPTTARVKTGRVGGLHHYFTLSPGAPVPSRKDDGLEIKADGSYVVAAGSQHQSGAEYQWIAYNVPIATAPDWLIDYARRGPERITIPPTQKKHTVSSGLVEIYSPSAWNEAEEVRLRSALAFIPATDREIWLRVGMALHWTSWERAFQIFDDWSSSVPEQYDRADQHKTWKSFERPYNGQRITLATIFHLASQYGWSDETRPINDRSAQSDEAEIARLAQLPPLTYERERKEAAKRLGCRESILDKVIAAARGETEGAHRQGQELDLREPEPWPEAVDGDALLSQLSAIFTGYVVMSRAAADATALWVLHAYLIEAADATPRLAIKSPEKRCGKTRLLSIIAHVAPRALATSNISPAAMFRTIEAAKPTLLIDEADTFVTMSEELRGVINSGHTRTTAYVVRTEGEDLLPRRFSTWAPIAFATIGKLPGTVEDRSITIPLRRRRPDENVERLRRNHVGHLHAVASRATRFTSDHSAEVAALDPGIPDQLHDRAADNWRPLLAIADIAGGGWPERARTAAITLSADSAADQDSMRTMMLNDIRSCFQSTGIDRVASDALVSYLVNLDDRPWPEFNKGRSITKAGLARLLKPFRILPSTIRLDGDRTAKGYYLSTFEDAFTRYLPAQTATASQNS